MAEIAKSADTSRLLAVRTRFTAALDQLNGAVESKDERRGKRTPKRQMVLQRVCAGYADVVAACRQEYTDELEALADSYLARLSELELTALQGANHSLGQANLACMALVEFLAEFDITMLSVPVLATFMVQEGNRYRRLIEQLQHVPEEEPYNSANELDRLHREFSSALTELFLALIRGNSTEAELAKAGEILEALCQQLQPDNLFGTDNYKVRLQKYLAIVLRFKELELTVDALRDFMELVRVAYLGQVLGYPRSE